MKNLIPRSKPPGSIFANGHSHWHANAVAEGSVEEPKLNVLMGIKDESLTCYVNGALQDSNSQGAPKPNMMPTMDDNWLRTNHQTALTEHLDSFELQGIKYDLRTTYLGDQLHSYSETHSKKINYSAEWLTVYQVFSNKMHTVWTRSYEYYNDAPGNKRSGKRKFYHDSRNYAWGFYNYDTRGRTTIKGEPLDGAPPPSELIESSLEPTTVAELAALPLLSSQVTTYDYEPLATSVDSHHLQDSRKAREVSEWIVQNGTTNLIARTWYVYTRSYTGGLPTLTTRTIKAASSAAEFSDAANAISITIHYSGAEDYDALPDLWNLPLRAEEADGTLRTWEYELGEWQNQTFTPNPFGKHLRITQRTGTVTLPYGLPNISTYTVEVRNNFGDTLLRETHLYTGSQTAPLLNHEISRYDAQGHLLTTHYADGTALSNIWDCCRLQERRERSGATTHFIEYPWVPRWSAEAQTSHANLPGANGYYPTTEYLRDGAGRVTNTVESLWHNGQPASNQPTLQSSTLYPHVSNDYSIHYNPLGVATTNKTTISNGAEIREEATAGVTHTTTRYKNGSTIRETKWDGKWRRETQETKYNALGERLELQITEASDAPIVTNSITHYDLLGRALTTTTPLGTTSNFYAGASTRLTRTTRTGSPDTLYLYDALGTLTTTILDIDQDGAPSYSGPDRITATTTHHEADSSHNWWQVTNQIIWPETDSSTALTTSVSRTRLTGLGTQPATPLELPTSTLLTSQRETIDWRGNTTRQSIYLDSDTISEWTFTERPTSIQPEIQQTIANLLHFTVSSTLVTTRYTYDAWGRQTTAVDGRGNTTTAEYNALGQIIGTENAAGNRTTYAYDALGRQTAVTDPLTNTTYTAYDGLNNIIAQWGAVYPVAYAYNSTGRKIAIATTRNIALANTNVQSASSAGNYSHLPCTDHISGYTAGPLAITKTYEPHRDLITQVRNETSAGVISQYDYTNDAIGRRVSRHDSGLAFAHSQTNDFGYNQRSEVISAVMHTNAYGYIYDPIGNRLVSSHNAETNTYTANNLNQYTQIDTTTLTTQEPTYDADGNMIYDGREWFYVWNGENRLVLASNAQYVVTYESEHDNQGWY